MRYFITLATALFLSAPGASATTAAATTAVGATAPIPSYVLEGKAPETREDFAQLMRNYESHWSGIFSGSEFRGYQYMIFSGKLLHESFRKQCNKDSTCAISRDLFTQQLAYTGNVDTTQRPAAYAIIARHYGMICKAEQRIRTKDAQLATPFPEGIDADPRASRIAQEPLVDAQWYAQALLAHVQQFPAHYRELSRAVAIYGNVTPHAYERLAPQLKAIPKHPYTQELTAGLKSNNFPNELIGIVTEYARIPTETFSFQEIAPCMPAHNTYNFVGIRDLKGFHNWIFCRKRISKINFESNYLTELPAHEFDGVQIPCNVLSFKSNQIRSVPATLLATCSRGLVQKAIHTLVLADNPITQLPQAFCDAIERKNPVNLTWLDVRACPLTSETYTALQYACAHSGHTMLFADEPSQPKVATTCPCVVS